MFTSTEAFVSNDSDKLQHAALRNSPAESVSVASVFNLEIEVDPFLYATTISGRIKSEYKVTTKDLYRSAFVTTIVSG